MKTFLFSMLSFCLTLNCFSQNHASVVANRDLPVAVADTIMARGGIPISFRPLLNDIQNSADTMIMHFSLNDAPQNKHWGIASVVNDTFNYLPIYQANGIDRFRYRIGSSTEPNLAMGDIVIICESKFYDSLQISNINAGVNGGSFLFSRYGELPGKGLYLQSPPDWDQNFTSHFIFPKGDPQRRSTLFNNTLWAGGLDSQNMLHFAGEKYKQGPGPSQGIDFQPGPIANQYNTNYLLRYLRTWKVSRAEVEYHINNFWKSGYLPIEAILNWPGNGNTSNGEAAILAPYYDNNADGLYNCLDGDYPLIRGDETIFLMFNDDLEHTESYGTRIKLEVHAMVYGFDNPSDTAIYNTVFVHYDLINRSDETYHDFYAGIFTDTDLGDAQDDYVGCDVQLGTFYTYNGKPVDGSGQAWAYGENPPAQSVTILAGPYKDADQLDNPAEACSESINGLNYGNGIVDDERIGMTSFMTSITGEPSVYADHFYYFLQGKWMNGSPMIYGGNGYAADGGVGPECKYIFPGDSDPNNWGTNCIQPNGGYNVDGKYWTEVEVQNPPSDRKGLVSMGPFTFNPGQVQEIEVAYCVGEATEGVPGSGLDNLLTNVKKLRDQIIGGDIISPNNELGLAQNEKQIMDAKLYPNPTNTYLTIEIPNKKDLSPAHFVVYNLIGSTIMEGMITDYPRQTINISNLEPGLYLIKIHNKDLGKVMKFVKR